MPLFWGSRAREGQRMEGRTRRARGGWAAREDQAGVQAAGWAIWRWAQKSTAKTKWGRSTLRTTASKICPSCGKTRGRGINHSSSLCLISGGSGQGFEACWISPKFAGTLQLCLRTWLWNPLEIYFWAQGFITRVRNWVEVCRRLTLDSFHVWEEGKEYF